jgi:hypothetical protein
MVPLRGTHRVVAVVAVLVIGVLAFSGRPAGAEGQHAATRPRGVPWVRSIEGALADAHVARPTPSEHDPAPGAYVHSQVECKAVARDRANVNLDCDNHVLPNNEPDIVVDPTDPKHLVASSNDYDSAGDEFYTTFNGGQAWTTGDMSLEDPGRTGSDPVTSFDPKSHTLIHSSLNFLITKSGLGKDGDVVVSLSKDGGITWGRPVQVADGIGADDSAHEIFNDKPWIATDTNPSSPYYGRTYLTWSGFGFASGHYLRSPIMMAYSDDGGRDWTNPREVSGSSPSLCEYQSNGAAGRCDEDGGSFPMVGPDGTVYVGFYNSQNRSAWESGDRFESSFLVVRSDDGGQSWSDPALVASLEDGTADLPVNALGRATMTGLQLRLSATANMAVDPATGRIWAVFYDNRAGKHDVANPVTNLNVYMVVSDDAVHWSTPFPVDKGPGDQWLPWVDVNPRTGQPGVLYEDREEQHPGLYDTNLATPGEAGFVIDRVDTVPSNARADLFFRAGVPGCRHCSTFNGDYIRFDYGSDGRANMTWTDMRRISSYGGRVGHTENIFFARQ